jgi:hypothetical protein
VEASSEDEVGEEDFFHDGVGCGIGVKDSRESYFKVGKFVC